MPDDISSQILKRSAIDEGRELGNEGDEPSIRIKNWEQMETRESGVKSLTEETVEGREIPELRREFRRIS